MGVFPQLSLEELQKKYNDFAPTYRRSQRIGEWLFMTNPLRREVMRRAQGRILDVACGTGENFVHFPDASPITAIDLSPEMLGQAQAEAQKLGLQAELHLMDAQNLEFPNASFDSVVSALSTCTFPDPIQALREMGRVCRPDGRVLLFEHGRSQWGWAGRWMDRQASGHFATLGCRWNQQPLELVKSAGLKIVTVRRARLGGVFSLIEASPNK